MWDEFFSLRSTVDLRRFLLTTDPSLPEFAALRRYAATWPAYALPGGDPDDGSEGEGADGPFDPAAHVSPDRSAALFAGCPCIFLGTNSWSAVYSRDPGATRDRVASLAARIGTVRTTNPRAVIVVAVVPEKDYTIDRMFLREGATSVLNDIATDLRDRLAAFDISLVSDDYLDRLPAYQTLADYRYPDSHLPAANYVQIFARFLRAVGADWESVRRRLRFEAMPDYCDLAGRLAGTPGNPVTVSLPAFSDEAVRLAAGDETFAQPLGDTWQVLANEAEADPRSLLILGDSHCSIYAKRKMTFLCANTFATTEFCWNPCGFRKPVGAVDQPVIFMEVAQRFLFAG